MMSQYATDLPAGRANCIESVAIVGAGGQMGSHFAKALLETGKHTVTALTRKGSNNELPTGVKVAHVDYDDELSLVAALEGQHFLIITLAVTALPDTQSRIIRAAAKAGIKHIMPNIFGMDDSNQALLRDDPLSAGHKELLAEIEAAGLSWTTMICSLWYEYSLVMGPIWFGFDFPNKKLTLYDDGKTNVNITTWEQCARAVAALLSLKALPEDEDDESLTVKSWRNKPLVVSSFLISQLDMFESWKRVSGDADSDWTIEREPSKERYDRGMSLMASAQDPVSARMGAATASFARLFFPNGGGNYESSRGLDNERLLLPKEDLDERTAVAKEMLEQQYAVKVFTKLAENAKA